MFIHSTVHLKLFSRKEDQYHVILWKVYCYSQNIYGLHNEATHIDITHFLIYIICFNIFHPNFCALTTPAVSVTGSKFKVYYLHLIGL